MTKLKELYNPLSDTYLVLEELKGFMGVSYSVHREPRCPEFLLQKRIHNGIFSPYRTSDFHQAQKMFETRLVSEADADIRDLIGFTYTGPASKNAMKRKFDLLNVMMWVSKNGKEAYNYILCDPPSRRLYAFEREYFGYPCSQQMTIGDAQKLIKTVATDYGLYGSINFSTYEQSKYSTYLGETVEILGSASLGFRSRIEVKLHQGMVDKRILLHEMAHLITDQYIVNGISHGPHFAMVAAQLYDRYCGIDREKYFALACDEKYKIFGPNIKSMAEVLDAVIIDEMMTPFPVITSPKPAPGL